VVVTFTIHSSNIHPNILQGTLYMLIIDFTIINASSTTQCRLWVCILGSNPAPTHCKRQETTPNSNPPEHHYPQPPWIPEPEM
jgi:hypothetical protein